MNIYERLAEHLDQQPGGYPHTGSGVEIRILQHLFSDEDAALALHLTLIPEQAGVVARRAGMSELDAAVQLESMARRGLITSLHPQDGPTEYMATQFAVGFYEYQVETIDEELARDATELFAHVEPELWQKAPQVRTIPVGESIPNRLEVFNYEQASALIESYDKFRVSPCICRKKEHMLGRGCDKPLETCLTMGVAADYYERNNNGRAIDKAGALAILEQADEAGLVLQPANTKGAGFICCCCGDCCDILKIAKRHPQPAAVLVTSFFATVDAEACSACGDCELRCQMAAIAVDNGHALVDLDRCIGCGLCVTTCPDEAVTLVHKDPQDLPQVPANEEDLYISMLRARGLVNTTGLIKMVIRSKKDRLLASL